MRKSSVTVLMVICISFVRSSNFIQGSCGNGSVECKAGDNWRINLETSKCILETQLCDGTYDCTDGSDENYCINKLKGFNFQFIQGACDVRYVMCRTGIHNNYGGVSDKRCVAKSWVCDSDKDCLDGSDEMYCPYNYFKGFEYIYEQGDCPNEYYKCETGSLEHPYVNAKNCLEKSWICDGNKHCSDGSDEKYCPYVFPGNITPTTSVPPRSDADNISSIVHSNTSHFPSVSTTTAATRLLINQTRSSILLTTSSNMIITSTVVPSTSSMRTTLSTTLSPRSNLESSTRQLSFWNLTQGFCSNGYVECKAEENISSRSQRSKCILESQLCDGTHDCTDGSDESHCFTEVEGFNYKFITGICEDDKVMCRSGENIHDEPCIPSSWICDFDNDCKDKSDEIFCPYNEDKGFHYVFKKDDCPNEYFKCESGLPWLMTNDTVQPQQNDCIKQTWICDGYQHCRDGSDEKYCPYVFSIRNVSENAVITLTTTTTTTSTSPKSFQTTTKTTSKPTTFITTSRATENQHYTTVEPIKSTTWPTVKETHDENLGIEPPRVHTISIISLIITLISTIVLFIIIIMLYYYRSKRQRVHYSESVQFCKLSSLTDTQEQC